MSRSSEERQKSGTALPVVAHIHWRFFKATETFIYNAIQGAHHYHPILIAREFINLDAFPFPPSDCFSLVQPPWTWRWLRQGSGRRFLDRELEAERFLRLRRAKLLHAHFGLHGIWGLRMRRAMGLPLVTNFYGHDLSRDSYVASCRQGYLELFKEGSLFLVEGPHMQCRLEALGCPAEKIIIQRIAIPISRMPYVARKPKAKEKKAVIIFSGRFVEKKGLLIALQALHEVWRRRTDFEFRVIGDGPLRPEVERFIRDHEMGLCVRLLGFLDYRSYQEQMMEADLFLHPSVTAADGDSEGGAPTTILEAQALGLPIISTFHADIPHVVLPGASALLSAEKDIAGLTANIMRLLENRDLWARMGEAGRRHVAQFHDMDREGARLEMIYDDLIKAARKQG